MSAHELTGRDCDTALKELRVLQSERDRVMELRRDGRVVEPPTEYRSRQALSWRGQELSTLWSIPIVVDASVPAGILELRKGARTVAVLHLEAAEVES